MLQFAVVWSGLLTSKWPWTMFSSLHFA